jgi:hypothetical protein
MFFRSIEDARPPLGRTSFCRRVGKGDDVAHACTASPARALIKTSIATAMVARSW